MKLRRSFWVALVLFLGLFAYIRYYESRRPLQSKPDVIPFLAVESTRITAITATFGADSTRMEKRNGRWWVTRPVDFPADPTAVEALLSRCRNLEVMRRFPMDPTQRQRYGLDYPGGRIRLDLNDGTTKTLTIGAVAAASPAFYIQIDRSDTLALLLDQTVENYFRKPTSGWRDPTLMDFRPSEAVSLRLESGGRRVRVDRVTPMDGWRVVEPFPGLADNQATADFLKGLAATRARSWPEDNPGSLTPFGLNPPAGSVTVVDTAGQEHRLILGADLAGPTGAAEIYAWRSGWREIYGVPAAYRMLAGKEDLFFRQKHLFPSGLRDVTSLRFDAGPDSAIFFPDSAGVWRLAGEMTTPGAPPADRTPFVTGLAQATADSIVSAGAIEARFQGEPALRIETRGAAGPRARFEVAGSVEIPGRGELWPARFTFPDQERPGEVFLLSPDLIRPLIAVVRK